MRQNTPLTETPRNTEISTKTTPISLNETPFITHTKPTIYIVCFGRGVQRGHNARQSSRGG